MALKEELTQKLGGKTLQEAENTEIYQALLQPVSYTHLTLPTT